MKTFFSIAFFFLTILFFSCETRDTADANNPAEVLDAFFDALGSQDIPRAKSLSTPDSKDILDMMEQGFKMDTTSSLKNLYDKSTMKFGDAIINDDLAIIPVTEETSGEVIKYKLKKINGKWKVAFDKSTLTNTGMETIQNGENNSELDDNSAKATDSNVIENNQKRNEQELNSLNMDSLRKELEGSMDQ